MPVLSGAALAGIDTQPLLDSVVTYLPSLLDRTDIDGLAVDPDEPFSALAFKVEHGVGRKAVGTRVYSGSLPSLTPLRGRQYIS